MELDRKSHWENIYETKSSTQVSWYAPHLERSLSLIQSVAAKSSPIIDVGGGASMLVDDLLKLGFSNLSVLDISSAALEVSRQRLGDLGKGVRWLTGDITEIGLPSNTFDLWHDRAVFHFLTEPAQRRAYVDRALRSVKPGGHLIVATFSLEGPLRCSGLEVVRYSADALSQEFGPDFVLQHEIHESHLTPGGAEQKFIFCVFQRRLMP